MAGYIESIFINYVQGTAKGAIVREMTIKLCTLTYQVQKAIGVQKNSVYITTKVIKKNYDKRTAEENDFILRNGWKVVRHPHGIYKNKDGKRGDYVLIRLIQDSVYLASIEVVNTGRTSTIYVVAMYRLPKPEKYLKSYELIWSWKGGAPSS